MDRRAEIQSIKQDISLSEAEKSRRIQQLFTPAVSNVFDESSEDPDALSCRICLENAARRDCVYLYSLIICAR
jgi:hypothetical protein